MKQLFLFSVLMLVLQCANKPTSKLPDEQVKKYKIDGRFLEHKPNVEFCYVYIHGCEYILIDSWRQMGLTKIDCDCVPNIK